MGQDEIAPTENASCVVIVRFDEDNSYVVVRSQGRTDQVILLGE
jgi:hypothetical protein